MGKAKEAAAAQQWTSGEKVSCSHLIPRTLDILVNRSIVVNGVLINAMLLELLKQGN